MTIAGTVAATARGRWSRADLASDARRTIGLVSGRGFERIGLSGNSPGAMIAIQVATADPRVRGVVASNCPAHIADFLLTTPRQMLLTLPRPLQMVPAVRISVDHFYSYEQLINGRASVTRIRTDPTFTAARRLSIGTYRSLLDRNGPGAVHALHRPLLVIQGRTDRLQPAEQSRSSSTPPTTPASTNSLTLATYRTSRTPASALSLDPPMAGLSGRSRIRAKGPLGWDDVGLLHQLFPSHRRHFQ